jgi:hypothetical protein
LSAIHAVPNRVRRSSSLSSRPAAGGRRFHVVRLDGHPRETLLQAFEKWVRSVK